MNTENLLHELEEKIHDAVTIINQLRQEKIELEKVVKNQEDVIFRYRSQIDEMERKTSNNEGDRKKLESGLKSAIAQLDKVESGRETVIADRSEASVKPSGESVKKDRSGGSELSPSEEEKNSDMDKAFQFTEIENGSDTDEEKENSEENIDDLEIF